MITPLVCAQRKPAIPIAAVVFLLLFGCLTFLSTLSFAQSSTPVPAPEETRKIKKTVAAEYPELARKVNITGTVRLELLVMPDGKVKEAKVLGGNPVLAQAFMTAALKWEYEPAPHKSTVIVKCEFKP